MPLRAIFLTVTLLSLAGQQFSQATLINGSTSLCQCTPRLITTSRYLDSLNSYAADMTSLLSQIATQLASLGLKFSDFSATTLARLLQISASTAEATKVTNALLASLNSSSSSGSSSSTGSESAVNCTSQDSLAFFGSTVYQAVGSGGTFSSGRWTVALSGAALTIDYGVKSCTTQTQYIQQICVDGHPSQVYIFVQANSTSSASLVSSSLTASNQTGAICVTVNQQIMAFSLLPKSLKTIFSLMPSYQFNLTVAGCFNAIPAACTPTIAPTTTIPCTSGNALAEPAILPTEFFYNVQLSRVDGAIINANATTRAAVSTFLADLTADGCRAVPNITQVCATGNFRRMKIGRLRDYQGTIEEFPGSINVTATRNYQRFCYNISGRIAILAIEPAELFSAADTQFKFFPEARGCYDPVTSACTARPACVGPLEVGWHSEQLPQQSFTATNMTFTGGQWVTTGPDASLFVDMSAGGCRKSAAVTRVCVTSTNSRTVTLMAIFPVGEDDFSSTSNLTGTILPNATNPWCQTFSAAPTMKNLLISFPSTVSNTGVSLKWTITGCFSSLQAYCLTTTAAPVTTTAATTTPRPPETCSSGLATLTNSDANLPASAAISGATFVSASNSWTVATGNMMIIDLTVNGCRLSAKLLAICISGNAASVRIDYILEDNSRVILANSTTQTQPASGVPLCFNFPSTLYAKSLVLRPTALKTAFATDSAYSMSVSLSGCYSAILTSCHSPICACSPNYRPVFYDKKYYRMYFKVTSGYYATYRSSFASLITTDYQDLFNITDTAVWQNFGNFKDKYEAIDQVAYTNGSVVLNSRLIMYNGGYRASELTSALAAGMTTGFTAGGTFGVDPSTVVITDFDTTTTTTVPTSNTTVRNSTPSALDLALLLGLLIPLLIILIVATILLILLCKYRRCCCFAQQTAEQASGKQAEVTDCGKDSSNNTAVSSSQDQLVPKDEAPQSARTQDYNYAEPGPGEEPEICKDNLILPMPAPAVFAPAPALQEAREYETACVQTPKHPRKKTRSRHNTSVCPEPTAESQAPGPSSHSDQRRPETPAPPWAPFPGGPRQPKSVSVETTTYWIGGKR